MTTRNIFRVVICLITAAIAEQAALAQAGTGDMWSQLAEKEGLFSPHVNTCDSSTEAYISIGNGSLGFCFEKSERTAALWENAKQTCASVGKRLPEVAEYKYACNNAGSYGLSNMTNDYEWTSNQAHHFSSVGFGSGILVEVLGNGSCDTGAYGVVASDWQTTSPLTFHCVR
jgi:hypothetical protein